MIFCEQCGHWHGNSKRAHTNSDELTQTRLRSFVAVMATYPETMKHKHRTIALRAYCAAHGLDIDEATTIAREYHEAITS